MATAKRDSNPSSRKRPPAKTPQARENQLIAMTLDLAEKQIREGTATSQVMTHFLKLATAERMLEMEQTRAKNKLLEAQVRNLESMANAGQTQEDALRAFRTYSGQEPGNDEDYA